MAAAAPLPATAETVDVDAIAAAVRACPGVADLDAGHPAELATYLPGRRVAGVRVADATVEVQVRAQWGRPLPEIAGEVQVAVAPLAGGRRVDVLIADVVDISTPASAAWTDGVEPPVRGSGEQ
ncbi:hypothetical protein [Hamadaea tsunoensis]|uniref:hypothetical protein n=1 Tax=Hamadaea tsunoensis TaxID=53368 RepID=UPI0003F7E773|nr:hypothetical protein [Hamadaea tsunoensis]